MRFSSFQEMLRHYAETTPEAPALWVPGERGAESISFSGLEDAVERRSTELKDGGKTCLAVFADGSGPCVITIFAAVRAGLQVVLLDDSLPDDTAAALIRYTDADAIWSADDERVSDLAEKLQDPIRIHRDPYGVRCQPCGLSTVKMTDAERKPVRHKRPFLL